MVTDRQVRKLLRQLSQGSSLVAAALKSGMSEKTARRYRDMGKMPSESRVERDWRTRVDPFELVWPEIEEQLRLNPGLQGNTLFEWLDRKHKLPQITATLLAPQITATNYSHPTCPGMMGEIERFRDSLKRPFLSDK